MCALHLYAMYVHVQYMYNVYTRECFYVCMLYVYDVCCMYMCIMDKCVPTILYNGLYTITLNANSLSLLMSDNQLFTHSIIWKILHFLWLYSGFCVSRLHMTSTRRFIELYIILTNTVCAFVCLTFVLY